MRVTSAAWLIVAPIAIAGGVLTFMSFEIAAHLVRKSFSS
jgi:hypothetical protein